jgi:hypothetical protein
MALFKKLGGYQSEYTQFLKDFKQSHPQVEQNQIDGRNRLWDKAPINLEDVKRDEVSRVKQKAYVYQPD